VEGKRGTGETKRFGDLADRPPFGSCLHQQAKDLEPGFLSQSAERSDGFIYFHDSKYIDIDKAVKVSGPPAPER
jgi:hypothetical protein